MGKRPDYTPWPFADWPKVGPALDRECVGVEDVGYLVLEFDAFYPNALFDDVKYKGDQGHSKWPTIVPVNGPPIPKLDPIIEKMIKSTWTFAEPTDSAPREFDLRIGTRGQPFKEADPHYTYHPQVRPTISEGNTPFEKKTMKDGTVRDMRTFPVAQDWAQFNMITRTNAVTFRGDTRSPQQVIVKGGGFKPPASRTDPYYTPTVAKAFQGYMNRRYGCNFSKDDPDPRVLDVMRKVAPSPEDKKLLVDYTTWRMLVKREEKHLARMVDHELLKGYISTAKRMGNSIYFGTAKYSKPGWLYVVLVHGGFELPADFTQQVLWSTIENEIAQLGEIPPERIVGFTRLDALGDQNNRPVGPIFFRRTFRKQEPKACKMMYDFMSGALPDMGTHALK